MLTGLPDLSKGAIASPTTANILTSEELATIMPEHVAELWLSYGNGLTLIDILTYGFSDRSELTSAESWSAFVENFPIKTMTVGGNVSAAGGAGQTASFSLSTNDLTNSYGQSNYAYYPRVDQVCYLGTAPNYKQCHIRSISQVTSTVTITIAPSDITYQITASDIAVGKVIPLGGIVKSIESAATTGTKVGYDEYTFWAQVMKEASGFGGMELQRKHWHNIDGKYFYDRDVMHKEFQLKAGMNASLFLGEEVTNTAVTNASVADSSNVRVRSTKGLWQWASDKGFDVTYSATTGFTPTDLDSEGEYYRSVGVTADQILKVCGNGYYVSVENGCKDYITGASGALNHLFTPLAEGQKHDLTVGFKSIDKNGFKYMLVEDHTFNNPYLLKNIMFSNCLSIPMSTVQDAKSRNWFPNLSIRYVGNTTANRKMVIGYFPGMTGALSRWVSTPILSSGDVDHTHWMTHWGAEVRNPHELVRSYPA